MPALLRPVPTDTTLTATDATRLLRDATRLLRVLDVAAERAWRRVSTPPAETERRVLAEQRACVWAWIGLAHRTLTT